MTARDRLSLVRRRVPVDQAHSAAPDRRTLTWTDYQAAFDAYADTHLQSGAGARVAAGRLRTDFNHWLAVDRGWPPVAGFDIARLLADNPALCTGGRGSVHLPPDLPDDPLTSGGAAWRGIAMHAALTHP